AEAELGCHALALPGRYLAALEEDAETVAPLSVLVGEDAQDVELGHRPPRLEDRQEVLDLERGDLHPVVLPLLPLDLDEAAEGVLTEGAQDQLGFGRHLDRLAEGLGQLLDPALGPFLGGQVVEVLLHRLGERAQRGIEQRSEEHTSELQSPYDLVCRLLLEKKK